jgi:hypothetical protein
MRLGWLTYCPSPEVLRHGDRKGPPFICCAICGEGAQRPAQGGLQLSVLNGNGRVISWAVHQDCLTRALAERPRAAFLEAFR